eukprot:GABW01000208.1.p1 GENE.GABW01000208.1~~GABW01000208.1.p1  ORF type:complete len:109 (-),score=36.32 GABW01000208.1:3-329(-)
MEATAGMAGAGGDDVRERMAYLVDENDKYMAKITDLENQLKQARSSVQQVEKYYHGQNQQLQQEKFKLQHQCQQLQSFAAQAQASKQQYEQQIASLNDRRTRLEAHST